MKVVVVVIGKVIVKVAVGGVIEYTICISHRSAAVVVDKVKQVFHFQAVLPYELLKHFQRRHRAKLLSSRVLVTERSDATWLGKRFDRARWIDRMGKWVRWNGMDEWDGAGVER